MDCNNKTSGKRDGQEEILIRESPSVRNIGAAGLVFGFLMSFLCYRDYLMGNETASVGLALGFLLIPGAVGLWLFCYGSRYVRVNGGDILYRDFIFRKHRCRLDEIRTVRSNSDGFSFWSREGKLFQINQFSPPCQTLLAKAERAGAWMDIPGWLFSFSQIAAEHPCAAKRCFTVRLSGYAPYLAPKLEVRGKDFTCKKRFHEPVAFSLSDIKEVRLEKGKGGWFTAQVNHSGGGCLVKIHKFFVDVNDSRYIFTLFRHLKELGIPILGLEDMDEEGRKLMDNGFVLPEAGQSLFEQEYERLFPVLKRYEETFSGLGLRFLYGAVTREAKEELEERLFLPRMDDGMFQQGFYFYLLQGDELMYDQKARLPLYECIQLLAHMPEWQAEQRPEQWEAVRDFYYFRSLPMQAVSSLLEYFLNLAQQKKHNQV